MDETTKAQLLQNILSKFIWKSFLKRSEPLNYAVSTYTKLRKIGNSMKNIHHVDRTKFILNKVFYFME